MPNWVGIVFQQKGFDSMTTSKYIAGGLLFPWVSNEPCTLYRYNGIVYISLANLSVLIAHGSTYINERARSYVLDKDTIAPPGTYWSRHRLTYIVRVSSLYEMLPLLTYWDNEKITRAMAQLEWEEGEEQEEEDDVPPRKRKYAFDEDTTKQLQQKLDELMEIANTSAMAELKRMINERF